MNGRILIDTNVILDFLKGDACGKILTEFDIGDIYASVISRMELLSFHKILEDEVTIIEEFLDGINIVPLNADVERYAISIRRRTNCKLPDAIVAASSIVIGGTLVTRDKSLANKEFDGLKILDPDKYLSN